RPDHLVVVLDDLGLVPEDKPKCPRKIADIQRLVILIEDQDHPIHDGENVSGKLRARLGRDAEAPETPCRCAAGWPHHLGIWALPLASSAPPASGRGGN